MREDLKIVGVFHGNICELYINGGMYARFYNLKYTGRGTDSDNMRLYSNDEAHVWLDYAIYK